MEKDAFKTVQSVADRQRVQVTEEKKNDVMVLRITGRLDALTSEEADKAVFSVIERGEHRLLLDFTGVTYLSSAGMRVLLSAYKRLKEVKGKVAVCSIEDGVLDVLKMSGFDDVLTVFPNEETALKNF